MAPVTAASNVFERNRTVSYIELRLALCDIVSLLLLPLQPAATLVRRRFEIWDQMAIALND